MLETELFALLEHTSDAAYSVSTDGEITSWNAAAVQLLGYPASVAIGQNVHALLQARDDLGTDALSGGFDSPARGWRRSGGIPHFELNVRTADGRRIWIDVSSILYENPRTGRRLIVRLTRDVTVRRERAEAGERLVEAARQLVAQAEDSTARAPVQPLSAQERRVLALLARGKTAAAVSRTLGISAQTLRNHLHRINRKLRTHSRLEAVAHARRRGIID